MAVDESSKKVRKEIDWTQAVASRVVPDNLFQPPLSPPPTPWMAFDLELAVQVTNRKIATPGVQDWYRVLVVPASGTTVKIRLTFEHPPVVAGDLTNGVLGVVAYALQGATVVAGDDLGSAMAHGSPGDENLGSPLTNGPGSHIDREFGPFDQPRAYYFQVLGSVFEVTNSNPYTLRVDVI